MSMIKVCVDPHCEAVWHNTPKKVTRCPDCDMRIIQINTDTYKKKYAGNFFQYDYTSKKLIPAAQRGKAVQTSLIS